VYQNGLLSLDAESVQPEDIFRAIGNACNITVIAHRAVFPDRPVTIHIAGQPVKEAVKTLVRTCGLKNYLLDFKKGKDGSTQLAKIDLFMGGGGKRVLVRPAEVPENPAPAQQPVAPPQAMEPGSSFSNDSKFQWDGSASIDFPKYTGSVPYETSKYSWNDDAKTFTKKTLDIIPSAVGDIVVGSLVAACDELARERGAPSITPDIVAAATEQLARRANMPPMVKKAFPGPWKTSKSPRFRSLPIISKRKSSTGSFPKYWNRFLFRPCPPKVIDTTAGFWYAHSSDGGRSRGDTGIRTASPIGFFHRTQEPAATLSKAFVRGDRKGMI